MKRKLTKQQEVYIEGQAKGQTKRQSAILAGYAVTGESGGGDTAQIESPNVMERLAEIRAEVAKNTGVTKEQVVSMFIQAADMAKLMADPQGLVAAARELGKMLGFYAPEVKKVTHGLDKGSLRQVLEEMTDDDLQRLANAKALPGEAVRIEDKTDG